MERPRIIKNPILPEVEKELTNILKDALPSRITLLQTQEQVNILRDRFRKRKLAEYLTGFRGSMNYDDYVYRGVIRYSDEIIPEDAVQPWGIFTIIDKDNKIFYAYAEGRHGTYSDCAGRNEPHDEEIYFSEKFAQLFDFVLSEEKRRTITIDALPPITKRQEYY